MQRLPGSQLCHKKSQSHPYRTGISVADPDHFDADPGLDPTSKKLDADPTMLYIKFYNKIFLLKNGL
jgi:hypothetical protein